MKETATLLIAEALAKREAVSVEQLRPPLYEIIDTDALNQVVASIEAGAVVEFRYCQYNVAIHGNGTVDISEREPS